MQLKIGTIIGVSTSHQHENWILQVKAIPNARKSEIVGFEADGALKIKLRAVPEDGKANKELVKLLAKQCGISKSCLEILSGETSRHKRLSIEGITKDKLLEKCGVA